MIIQYIYLFINFVDWSEDASCEQGRFSSHHSRAGSGHFVDTQQQQGRPSCKCHQI